MSFYADLQRTAEGILREFRQGVVVLRRTVTAAPNPQTRWVPGEVASITDYPLSATVRRLHQRFENGALVVETGDMVTFAVPSIAPTLGQTMQDGSTVADKMLIDGVERAITSLTPVIGAGEFPVAWKAWCAA